MTIIPEKLRHKYKSTLFTSTGKCDQYNDRGMVQQYSLEATGLWPAEYPEMYNLNGLSCLNGWAFGNLAVSAHDIAMFEYDVFAT